MNDFKVYFKGGSKYEVAGYNASGRNVSFEILEDEILSVKDILQRFDEARDPLEIKNEKIVNEKKELEKEKEKLEEENKSLTEEKNEFLEKWASGQNPAVLIENKDKFPRLYDSLKVIKGHHYYYAGLLYKSKKDFVYDNQHSPILEPLLWQQVGVAEEKPVDKNAEYEEKFKKADLWYSDKTYIKSDLVKRYSKLYELVVEKSSGDDPEKSSKWKLVTKD